MELAQPGIFITGTSTDVGKTFVGAGIARKLNQLKVNVIPRKPIESGCLMHEGELVPQDASTLKEAANYTGALSEICPYRFKPPVSPARAAHLVSEALTTKQLVNICLQGSEHGFLLVEGAGGFYSPLAENGLNADFATALQLPVLLVADDKLGAINHVLLSVEAIRARGLQLVGVVLNAVNDKQDEDMDNTADLRQHLDCPVFTIPFDNEGDASIPDTLIDLLMKTSKPTGISATG